MLSHTAVTEGRAILLIARWDLTTRGWKPDDNLKFQWPVALVNGRPQTANENKIIRHPCLVRMKICVIAMFQLGFGRFKRIWTAWGKKALLTTTCYASMTFAALFYTILSPYLPLRTVFQKTAVYHWESPTHGH